jgi:hypothetical protein
MVARRAHNPKVSGSNPDPATNKIKGLEDKIFLSLFHFCYPIATQTKKPPSIKNTDVDFYNMKRGYSTA